MGRRIKSSNEIFTEKAISEASKLLNISEDVVEAVVDYMILYILDDVSKQADESDYIKLKIPKICDLDLLICERRIKRIRVRDVYLENDFKERMKNSACTDKDYLNDAIIEGVSELIVDKFTKAINKIEEEDKYG